MSRIINKLVEASGGWEVFLYKTLRDVVNKVGLGGSNVIESIEEAREILEAYEALAGGHPDQARKRPVVVNDQSIEEAGKPIRVTPVIKTMKMESVEVDEPVEIKLEDIILTPAPRSKPVSKKQKAKVGVDKDTGASQGALPIPASYKIVDRYNLSVTTTGGIGLGRGSEDGQIRGGDVSGHVSVSGSYRLVFNDTSLGTGFICYEIVRLPAKMIKKQFEEGLCVQNGLTIEKLRSALQKFEKVIVSCNCGKEDCFGWKVVDRAIIEEAATAKAAKIVAMRGVKIAEEAQ